MRTPLIVVACSCLTAPPLAAVQPVALDAPAGRHARAAWAEAYQDAKAGPETSERWERTFKIGPTGVLDLTNFFGDVVVTPADGPEARVLAYKRARSKDAAEARRQVEMIRFEVSESPGRVEVRTVFPRTKNTHASVDFEVRVPAGASVAVRTIAGDISITKVKGEVRLESVSGDITATGTPQLAHVKSVSGDVQLSAAGSSDALSANTVSGNLLTRAVKARVLELATVTGEVKAIETLCERVEARSISGNVEFGGALARNGRYEFTSHSGDVRLLVAAPAGLEVFASSFSGDIHSELPLVDAQKASRQGPPQGPPHGPIHRELRGSMGEAGASVVVKTFSGTVTLAGPGPKTADPGKDKTPRDKPKTKP